MPDLEKRDELVVVHGTAPLNVETRRAALAASALTPLDRFYVRNHGPVPEPATDPRLRVTGLVDRALELSLDDLRRLPRRDVVATLQCAGNRRADLLAVRDIPGETPWGPGATGTARWSGVALADVLTAAGVSEGATDVAFIGADPSSETPTPELYGASIPLGKALASEVLLAWEMNGLPLRPVHGAPLRAVVPGYIGARSVKWLERIEVRDRPWDGYYQAVAYRLLAPDEAPRRGAGFALGEAALNTTILVPEPGATLAIGPVDVRGYAFAGGGRRVARVDVSGDGGRTWTQAELLSDDGRWSWRLWAATLELGAGSHELVARAWDSSAATQPERADAVWNPKGYVSNAWDRVRVDVGR